jgi:hyperosmotically inducible periplasmic protein
MNPLRVFFLVVAFVLAAPVLAANDAPPDGWLTTKAKLALLTQGELKSSQVHVDTNNGVVTLYGKVRDAAQKRAAERAVREVAGVRGVHNLLQVVPNAQEKIVARSDSDIREQVVKMLREDPALKDSRIEVKSVDKGVVLLAGRAASASDQLRAVADVDQIAGVRRVISQIQGPERASRDERELTFDREPRVEPRNSLTDTRITAQVKLKLLGVPNVPTRDINVDSNDGVVTLFGSVPDEAAKDRAESEAHKVSGVVRVRNQLEVVPSSKRATVTADDAKIERDLADCFGRSEYANIRYEVKAGNVRVTGRVASAWEKLDVMRLARSVDGVRTVHEELEIVPREKPEARRF